MISLGMLPQCDYSLTWCLVVDLKLQMIKLLLQNRQTLRPGAVEMCCTNKWCDVQVH